MTEAAEVRQRTEPHDFAAYVQARQQALLGFAILLCGERADAEDLLQTVLGRVSLRWERLVGSRSDIDAYVRTSLVNAHHSLWRRAFRRRERPTAELPEAAVTSESDDLDLWSRVLQLPERQRQVVALRFYEGLSVAETAAAMGSSEGTVKSQCARALARLRIVLEEEER